jgi:ABC-type uncharacterized transport system substrate-binding protein
MIVELAAKGRIPTIYSLREFVEVGGLMAYSVDLADIFRRLANLNDKILRGVNPGDVPFYQPTKFELSINLKTAKRPVQRYKTITPSRACASLPGECASSSKSVIVRGISATFNGALKQLFGPS